jgi:hypothetical protein
MIDLKYLVQFSYPARLSLFLFLLFPPIQGQISGRAESQSIDRQDTKPANPTYQQLVALAKHSDPSVDYVQMIAAASDLALAESFREAPNRAAMVAAFKVKDYKKAVELAETVLDYEFTNRGLHLATEKAYRELKDETKADFHHVVAENILQALLRTGDGLTLNTAYCVQSINEEYVIMDHFGNEVLSQSYLVASGSEYDLLEGREKKTGKKVGLYFDISGYSDA